MATTLATDVRLSIAHQTRFALRLASAISSNPDYAAANSAYSPSTLGSASSPPVQGAPPMSSLSPLSGQGSQAIEEAEGLHALAEQVVQLMLADASMLGGPRVAFANGVFVDVSLSLKPSFKELAVGRYKANVQSA
ncbi:hypothetical protein ACQ4PT_015033 [Festuca glaucescens]